MALNPQVLQFFRDNYAPGRVGLIGSKSWIGEMIRAALAGVTPDKRPSKWSHSFLLGPVRDDGYEDGSIYIYESDLHVALDEWQVLNGAQDSRLVKWCGDDIEHACVLDVTLPAGAADALSRQALHYIYAVGAAHFRYPVAELFGTLLAILTHTLNVRNIVDDKNAVQCATFVRTCFEDVGCHPVADGTDLTNTSPETLYQAAHLGGAMRILAEWNV